MQRGPVHCDAHHRKHRLKTADKEIEILECGKNAQIEHNVSSTYGPLHAPTPVIMPDEQTAKEAAERSDDNKYQETPIPPPIKDITRHEDEQILPPQLLEDKPVEQKHYRQEDHKCKRVKKHI